MEAPLLVEPSRESPAHALELALVCSLALALTIVLCAPVLRAPSERLFGMELAGRKSDPFTVMEQFGRPLGVGIYSQPVTDLAGALLARGSGAVAAYNWLVLLSFPLSAATAYLLARHLALAPVGATFAALAFAFSPFHLAHAGYHPHVAQTQWLPLYLLALWRCLDRASPAAVALLAAASAAVLLSNFYAALIVAVVTPVAMAAYWFVRQRQQEGSARRLAITAGTLALVAAAAILYLSYTARAVVENRAAFAFPRADLFTYSARWWSYLVPPVANPLWGTTARGVLSTAQVSEGLLEQQVTLGWGVIALGLLAGLRWRRENRTAGTSACVPILAAIGAAALVCSLSPEWTIGGFRIARPAAFLYEVAPMFRAYGRFGVVVQLMAALLAGLGLDRLLRSKRAGARAVAVGLVVFAASEYAVRPATLWRDVLPTSAHRWLASQPQEHRALDCTPLSRESASVEWLSRGRVAVLSGMFADCADPDLAGKLAVAGRTHLLVRRGGWEASRFAERVPAGLEFQAGFDDATIFAVKAQPPAVYTAEVTGFFPVERNESRTWRWMGSGGTWKVVNRGDRPIVAVVDLEIWALGGPRPLELRLDRREVATVDVDRNPRHYRFGPLSLAPGANELLFRPTTPPTVADDLERNGDLRKLSFAVGDWKWTIPEAQP